MQRTGFPWGEHRYRLNRATLAFWPQAWVVADPDPDASCGYRVVGDGLQLISFAKQLGWQFDEDSLESERFAECRRDLVKRGYSVWSIWEALERVTTSPNDEAVAELLACLENWFFVEKVRA